MGSRSLKNKLMQIKLKATVEKSNPKACTLHTFCLSEGNENKKSKLYW